MREVSKGISLYLYTMRYRIDSKNPLNKKWYRFDWFNDKEECLDAYKWLTKNSTAGKFKIIEL